MADEERGNPQQEIDHGQAAGRVMSDPIFKVAVMNARKSIVYEWETAPTVEKREAAYAKLQALGEVLKALGAIQNSGVMAEHKARMKGQTRH